MPQFKTCLVVVAVLVVGQALQLSLSDHRTCLQVKMQTKEQHLLFSYYQNINKDPTKIIICDP